VGQHEGGQVAAPVFKRIAEQVLPYLDVPRDVPVSPKLLQTAYKRNEAEDDASLEDFTPVDFSAQPEQVVTPESGVKKVENPQPAVTVALDEGGDIAVPDLRGKTMRDVTEMCLRLGLEPILVGSGLAVDVVPASGAKVRHGAKITVRFGEAEALAKAAKSAKLSGRNRNR
jgi:hypothetical protein